MNIAKNIAIEPGRLTPGVKTPLSIVINRFTLFIFVAVGVLLPLILSKCHMYRRESSFLQQGMTWAPFMYDEIFNHTETIDILFIGASLLWKGVDAAYIQAQLEKELGRPARVLMLGWPWGSEALKNVVLRDLLAHRKIDLIITSMTENPAAGLDFQPLMPQWLQPDDFPTVDGGLSGPDRLRLYGATVVGAPRSA